MGRSDLLHLLSDAPPALAHILNPAQGPLLPPIRSEIFGQDRFAQHGRSLGTSHRAARPSFTSGGFFPRLHSNMRALRTAHRTISQQALTGEDISPAAEWLLDNFHLIDAQLDEIEDDMPRSYSRSLPLLQDAPLAGLPRIYGVAWAFVAHTDSAFDETLLMRFLNAYQETRELQLGELWALPTTLRVVLVENLRRLAERVAAQKAARELANRVADQSKVYVGERLDRLFAPLRDRGVAPEFLAQLALRLQDRDARAGDRQQDWLDHLHPEAADAQTWRNAEQASDNLSVSNAISALRALGDADWPDIVAQSSPLMALLLATPVFQAEQAVSRTQTLQSIERTARRSGCSELRVAHELLGLMRDGTLANHWLTGHGRGRLGAALGHAEPWTLLALRLTERWVAPGYLAALMLGTLALSAWSLWGLGGEPGFIVVAALTLFPASEAVLAVVNRLISESARPQPLPRLAFAQGIPPAHRVMVAIPAMLTSPDATAELAHRLLLHHLANPEAETQFALLTDWADAPQAEAATDAGLLAQAVAAIEQLNARWGHSLTQGPDDAPAESRPPRFLLLHRPRRFSDSEQCWIGWERKRGKLAQLVRRLAAPTTPADDFFDLGPISQAAPGTRHLLTLDSDTQLPPGRLRELVGIAAHPANQPQIDPLTQTVTGGYGILQPRVVAPLPGPQEHTFFHALFVGQSGIDPYSAASSEVYQDLFKEGSFLGKGLIDVQAMHTVLEGRLPEDRVLSHDLLEGSLLRCAAVTDVTLVEEAPWHADVAAARTHRWTRGDWQLLPFIGQLKRYPMRAINRWKLLDNLRRPLLAPASVALLVLSLAGVGLPPLTAFALCAAAVLAGPLMGALASAAPGGRSMGNLRFYNLAVIDLLRAAAAGLWLLALALQHALSSIDAIGRAVWRLAFSHRHLLQWTTSEAASASAARSLPALWREHGAVTLGALLIGLGLWVHGSPVPWAAGLLCVAWALSPLWTWAVSRPRPLRAEAALSEPDRELLGDLARDIWRWFERCVSPADRHLPPDNLQTDPHDILAHRTSPTNIGLYLLSTACAREFGWIGTQELTERLEATLASLHSLERHRGHFLNWYDTESGLPLLPRYVSSVDSGNLCGHLLATAQACLALAEAPFDACASARAQQAVSARLTKLRAATAGVEASGRDWALANATATEALSWCLQDEEAQRASARRDEIAASIPGGPRMASGRLKRLAAAFEALAWEADFRFLHHPKRHLLHIGYRVAEQQLDAGFFDLLASEARLTSLLAIAKGDVPVRHWSALGRPHFAQGMLAGLRSWSGSMFEYLMPSLILEEPEGSVLGQAGRAAVLEQIAFADTQEVPWGISESAYAGRDFTLAYQYAPQGVPRLALRRTPPDELVIAPYATALAALVDPALACQNLRRLDTLGSRGRYGHIEALDFTPGRRTGLRFAPVSTFMAHHQGMSLVAFANVLLGGAPRRWGMANAHLEAVASLLHERAPREIPQLRNVSAGPLPQAWHRSAQSLRRALVPGSTAIEPTHLLSNGRLSVSLRPNGAGWTRWGEIGVTRTRDDALRDELGSFLYLRRGDAATLAGPAPRAPVFSLTEHPAGDPAASYQAVFHADRVSLSAEWADLKTQITVWVSPEDDIEFRQVEMFNRSDAPLSFELLAAFEPTLAEARADQAHPAFSNLFLQAHWWGTEQALCFERKPRLAGEAGPCAVHFVADSDPQVIGLRLQTRRERWQGRNRLPGSPLASFDSLPDAPLGNTRLVTRLDTGLDPVAALAVQVCIAPRSKCFVTFATALSQSPDMLRAMVDKYRQDIHVKRALLMSATLTEVRLRSLRLQAEHLTAVQALTTALTFSIARPAEPYAGLEGESSELCDRRRLWRFGISGDRPILLVSVAVIEGMSLLRALAQALGQWEWANVACDLVVVDAEPDSYLMELHREIGLLREQHITLSHNPDTTTTTGFHLLQASSVSRDELNTLRDLARLRFQADGRSLRFHVDEWAAQHERARQQRLSVNSTLLAPRGSGRSGRVSKARSAGRFNPQTGGFDFAVSAAAGPQRPWINVLANPGFGAHISESGGGYTWATNSRLNQLTAWSNDAVADPPSEWWVLQDARTLEAWCLTPSAWGDEAVAYDVSHQQGLSDISHRRSGLAVRLRWCVDAERAVKQVAVSVRNEGPRLRHLRLIGFVEWAMGASRTERNTTETQVWRERGADGLPRLALLCTQREAAAGFGGGTGFFALTGGGHEAEDWTCDRRECFDSQGRLVVPDHFGRRTGAGLDPCAAASSRLSLAPGERQERCFLIGHAPSAAQARREVGQAMDISAAAREAKVQALWSGLLGATQVQTPDPLFDALVNRWLLYQTVACRLWAKAGFYQAGGATGFRDQLQDSLALAWASPQTLRAQILRCAGRQFVEGDVQHWWHAPLGEGVRTHFSDDLLWLPYALLHYLRSSGDTSLLGETVTFLEGRAIPEGAEDLFETPTISAQQASVYEHAARTLDCRLAVGAHGLPLMGSGDWNDGMNRVGHEGRGESVWLAWFLCQIVAGFAPLARAQGEAERADRWEVAANGWKAALLGTAWDGAWFKRAFFDDGQALGSHENTEARIDLIAQAWSVLSGVAPQGLQRQAMASVEELLVDREAGLIRLLDPPLAHAEPSAGYIQAYPPGVRENGGQYAHAAVWALMATAELGERGAGDLAYRDFCWLSPAHRSADAAQGEVYGLEPYVMAGDIYSQPPYTGRGGWSWYTGSAAWLHRAAIESMFGLRLEAERLCFEPCLPTHWQEVSLSLRRGDKAMHFRLLRAPAMAAAAAAAVAPDSAVLQVGVWLEWRALGAESHFTVPLP